MTTRKIRRKDLLAACAETGAGDGQDPRFDAREGPPKVPNRKALQLCGQTGRTLAALLADCGDEVLRNLLVESVVPNPTSVRLLVTVYPAAPLDGADAGQVLLHLEGARGMFRSEIAAVLNRRKAPDLTFRVVDGPKPTA